MATPTQQVSQLDVIAGPSATGPVGAVRVTRSATGLQVSVDGGPPADIGGGGVATVTGAAVDNTDPANPIVTAVVPKRAAALTDASATKSPGTDKASQYVLPAATLTTARTLTLGTAGSPATSLAVEVVRFDLTANTFAVINGGAGAGTLLTFGASPTEAQGATFTFDGTNWSLTAFYFVAS